jgi:hypothetical protein
MSKSSMQKQKLHNYVISPFCNMPFFMFFEVQYELVEGMKEMKKPQDI